MTTNNAAASLQWPTLELMYKSVHIIVAVISTYLTPADSHTRVHHIFKYETISTTLNLVLDAKVAIKFKFILTAVII